MRIILKYVPDPLNKSWKWTARNVTALFKASKNCLFNTGTFKNPIIILKLQKEVYNLLNRNNFFDGKTLYLFFLKEIEMLDKYNFLLTALYTKIVTRNKDKRMIIT